MALLAIIPAASAEPAPTVDLPETMAAPSLHPAPSEPPEQGVPADSPPAEELACRKRLEAAGVTFTPHPPLSDPSGCSAPWPITVTELPGNVSLRPAATMTCAMADATATFLSDHAQPITQKLVSSRITAIDQVSAYVCRPRTSDAAKLSEHAMGNALDWGAVELANGSNVPVLGYKRDTTHATLMQALRNAACGPFKTVLGPGSDADHADHFHFDLAERRNGGTWCR